MNTGLKPAPSTREVLLLAVDAAAAASAVDDDDDDDGADADIANAAGINDFETVKDVAFAVNSAVGISDNDDLAFNINAADVFRNVRPISSLLIKLPTQSLRQMRGRVPVQVITRNML